MAGAAVATVVAQGLATLACLVLVQKKMPLLHLRRGDWKVTRAELALPARIGLPMGVQSSIIAIGNIIVQFVLNSVGTEAVGAYTASQRVEGLAMAPLASFGIATATYVAQNYGAQKYQRILRGVLRVSLMSSGFALAVGVVNFTMGRHITRLFVGEGYSEIVGMSHQYLMITGAFYIPLGLLFVWRNALQGLGKTFIPTLAGFMEFAARWGGSRNWFDAGVRWNLRCKSERVGARRRTAAISVAARTSAVNPTRCQGGSLRGPSSPPLAGSPLSFVHAEEASAAAFLLQNLLKNAATDLELTRQTMNRLLTLHPFGNPSHHLIDSDIWAA